MFRVKVRRVWLEVSFSFPAVLALMLLTGGANARELMTALLCCALHECGHLFFMLIFRRRPEAITLYGGGIKITPPRGRLDSFGRDLAVLLGGCGVNFLLAGVGWICGGLTFFVEVNLLLGTFNLLPFSQFDGGRVLGGGVGRRVRALFMILMAVLIILMSRSGRVSISFLMTFMLVAVEEVKPFFAAHDT